MTEWHEVADETLLMHWQIEKRSADQIGAWYCVTEEVVKKRLRVLGVGVGQPRKKTPFELLSDADFAESLARLGVLGLARELGCNRKSVYRRRARLGLSCLGGEDHGQG